MAPVTTEIFSFTYSSNDIQNSFFFLIFRVLEGWNLFVNQLKRNDPSLISLVLLLAFLLKLSALWIKIECGFHGFWFLLVLREVGNTKRK